MSWVCLSGKDESGMKGWELGFGVMDERCHRHHLSYRIGRTKRKRDKK